MACYNHLQSLPNGSSGLHVDDAHIYMYGVVDCFVLCLGAAAVNQA